MTPELSGMPFDSGPQPKPDQGVWTPRRSELHAWLCRNAPSLSELYQGAVGLIYRDPVPGWTRFVAHAVREIRNRLPDAISGIKGEGTLQYKNRLDAIVKDWKKAGFSVDGMLIPYETSGSSIGAAPRIQFPPYLFKRIANLLRDHERTRTKPEEAALRLFETCAPENRQIRDLLRPIVLQWLEVTDWFMKRVHDSNKGDADFDRTEFRAQFDIFEASLASLVRGFFLTVRELDEILEDTNS